MRTRVAAYCCQHVCLRASCPAAAAQPPAAVRAPRPRACCQKLRLRRCHRCAVLLRHRRSGLRLVAKELHHHPPRMPGATSRGCRAGPRAAGAGRGLRHAIITGMGVPRVAACGAKEALSKRRPLPRRDMAQPPRGVPMREAATDRSESGPVSVSGRGAISSSRVPGSGTTSSLQSQRRSGARATAHGQPPRVCRHWTG